MVVAASWGGAWRDTVVIGGEWVVEIKSGWPDLCFGTRKRVAGSLAGICGGQMGKREGGETVSSVCERNENY